jgi:hypothetical protein
METFLIETKSFLLEDEGKAVKTSPMKEAAPQFVVVEAKAVEGEVAQIVDSFVSEQDSIDREEMGTLAEELGVKKESEEGKLIQSTDVKDETFKEEPTLLEEEHVLSEEGEEDAPESIVPPTLRMSEEQASDMLEAADREERVVKFGVRGETVVELSEKVTEGAVEGVALTLGTVPVEEVTESVSKVHEYEMDTVSLRHSETSLPLETVCQVKEKAGDIDETEMEIQAEQLIKPSIIESTSFVSEAEVEAVAKSPVEETRPQFVVEEKKDVEEEEGIVGSFVMNQDSMEREVLDSFAEGIVVRKEAEKEKLFESALLKEETCVAEPDLLEQRDIRSEVPDDGKDVTVKGGVVDEERVVSPLVSGFILPEEEEAFAVKGTSAGTFGTDDQISSTSPDSQSLFNSLASSLLLESRDEHVLSIYGRENEVTSEPELENTVVEFESPLIGGGYREGVSGIHIDRILADEASFKKSEASRSDDTQGYFVPSETDSILPSHTSPNSYVSNYISDSREEIDHVTRMSPKQRLLFQTHVAETEVKELMSEVRNVTRQIKQEVRELKPDLTPTPEGKESSILPPSESREFVEVTDLACIREEQNVVDLDEERSQRDAIPCARDDMCFADVSLDEELSHHYDVEDDFFLSAKDAALQINAGIVVNEQSDILDTVSNLEAIRSMSLAIEIEQKLGAPAFDFIGGDRSTALGEGDAISKPLTKGVSGRGQTTKITQEAGVFKEQISVASHTFTELHQSTSSETYFDEGGILSKSAAYLMDTVTQKETQSETAVGLDLLPVTICEDSGEASVSAQKPDGHNVLSETERLTVSEIEYRRIHVIDSARIPANIDTESLDVSPKENAEALPIKTPKDLQSYQSMAFDVADNLCVSEDKRDKLPVLEDNKQTKFPSSALNVGGHRTHVIKGINLVVEEPQCGADVHETSLAAGETDSSILSETKCTEIELSVERELQETQPFLPVDTDTVEEYISRTSFEDRRKLPMTQASSASEDVTPIVHEAFVETLTPVVKKSFSTVDTLWPDYVTQYITQTESDTSSQQEQSREASKEKATEGSTETSDWKKESDSRFGIFADDIVMEDDLLEVTVTSENDGFRTEGKLFTTESGSTYLEFETGTTHSICVCEDIVSSQPVTLYAPDPSVSDRAEKFRKDALHEEGAVPKVSKTHSKERSESEVQRESSGKKTARERVGVTATKTVDDYKKITRRSKEPDKPPQAPAASSSGTGSRYHGYMASTLSRDLKVERSVAERSLHVNTETPKRKIVTAGREGSSTPASPSKPPVSKQTSTSSIPKTPQMLAKSRRVESRSASSDKDVQEKSTRKQASVSKHSKPPTPAVARSVATREDKLGSGVPTAKSVSDTTVHQRATSSSDSFSSSVRQSRLQSTVKKTSESGATLQHGRKRKGEEQTKLAHTKVSDTRKERVTAATDSGIGESLSEQVADSKLKARYKETTPELEPLSEIESGGVLKATVHSSEITKIDSTLAAPVPSSDGVPTAVERCITTSHSHTTDFKCMSIAETVSPSSAAPSPESCISVKSVLGKSSVVSSEGWSGRGPSPSPSASPVRAATSASRNTERFDYSTLTPSSLPSSPSRMVRQTTSQVGATQILTSEVFTRTVDNSGSIEVIYRQPTSCEPMRRVAAVSGSRSSQETVPSGGNTGAEGEVSLIDTTDSSLSDSVALPSSSSDHDLSVDTRLRTGGSPASPKPTRRSSDLIHDGTGPKLRTSDLSLDYFAVPSIAESEYLGPGSSVPRLEASSSKVPLDAIPRTWTSVQISAERLSPILDVHAVTPPRLKHKFQYEDDGEEEEAVAVFLSSPGKTDDLSSAPAYNPSLAAAASVQSMASELELLLQEVQSNMRAGADWDLESVKLRVKDLYSKSSLLIQFVNNEHCEGKFHTGDNMCDEVHSLQLTLPESQAIVCSSDRDFTALNSVHYIPTSMSLCSHSQIVWDQFSGMRYCVENSISVQEIYKQGTSIHEAVKFNLAIDSLDYLLNDHNIFFDPGEEDIHTQSTSGSETGYAVIESCSNPPAMIEEEASAVTDEDQESIPIDDIPINMQNIDWEPDELSRRFSVTSETTSLSENPSIFSACVSSEALRHDSVHLIETILDDESDNYVLFTRFLDDTVATVITDGLHSYSGESKYSNARTLSMHDGFTADLMFLETHGGGGGGDDDDKVDEPAVCPETPTPHENMLHFPDTTDEQAFKGCSQSNLLVREIFHESSDGFLSVHGRENLNLTDVEDFGALACNDVHDSESDGLQTINLHEFSCYRDTVYIKGKIMKHPELSSSSAISLDLFSNKCVIKKENILPCIPSASSKVTKQSLAPQPSSDPLSDGDLHLSDTIEKEQSTQKYCHMKTARGIHCSVSAFMDTDVLELFGKYLRLRYLLDCGSYTLFIFHESHNKPNSVFHSESDEFVSADGGKSSPRNVAQNTFIVRLDVPELHVDAQTDGEDEETARKFTDDREQNTDVAESVFVLPFKELEEFYDTASVAHKSGMEIVNYIPRHVVRKPMTFKNLVELRSDGSDGAVTLRVKTPQLWGAPVSGDSTVEDILGASEVYMRFYRKSSNCKKEMYDINFSCEVSSVVVSANKIFPMTTEPTTAENLFTNVQDVLDDFWEKESKPCFINLGAEDRTVTGIEEFKIKSHEKTKKFNANELTVKYDPHKLLVHISLSKIDSESRCLFCKVQSGFCPTDIEVQLTGSGAEIELNIKEVSAEISDVNDSTVGSSEVLRVQKKHHCCLPVDNNQEPMTDTEDLYLNGFPGSKCQKSTEKSRVMSVRGDRSSVTIPKILEVSGTEHLTRHSALIFTSKAHMDANTDVKHMDMSEEEYHEQGMPIISDFIKHMDYDTVALKDSDEPFPAEIEHVVSSTSFGSCAIKMTSTSSIMFSGSETDIAADNEAHLNYSLALSETAIDFESDMQDHLISTIYTKPSYKSSVIAPEEADHVNGGEDIQGIVTGVETLHKHHPEDYICVVDLEDQVCVCVAAEDVTQNAVCICMGKHHGELTVESNTLCGSSASHSSGWNATQEHEGMGCILQLPLWYFPASLELICPPCK